MTLRDRKIYTSTTPLVSLKPNPTETVTPITPEPAAAGGSAINIHIPTSKTGGVVPGIIGQQRIGSPNVIWVGNLKPVFESHTVSTTTVENVPRLDVFGNPTQTNTYYEVTTTTDVTTTVVIGYTFDMQMAICLGPDVHLLAIYADDVAVWTGDIGPARDTFTLPTNDTFLTGAVCAFSGGAYDQATEPLITDPDIPGYVGVAYLMLTGVRADMQLGALSFEVARYPNPLGLSEGNNKSGGDINIISAATEVITNGWGFGGLDISNLDTAKFVSLAATVASEGNYGALTVADEGSVVSVLTECQEQAGAIFFQDTETSKLTSELIRQNSFSPLTVPRFNEFNCEEIRDFNKSGWPETIEQLRGMYPDRLNAYEPTPVFIQNFASLSDAGRGKRTASVEYPFATNSALTAALLARDMALLCSPIISFTMLVNRDGATLKPGAIVMVTWPNFGLLNYPVVVLKVRKSPIEQNNVLLTVRQVVFPESVNIFTIPPIAPADPIVFPPVPPTAVTFYTAPYFMARARVGINTQNTSPNVYALVLPTPANDFQFSFDAYITNVPVTVFTDVVLTIDDGIYPSYGTLQAAIDQYDATTTGIIASVVIENVINPTNLVEIDIAGVRAGKLFVMVGNEILSFEDCSETDDGEWTLTNVHRALLDTVPETHSLGDAVFIINNNFGNVAGRAFPVPLSYTPEWLLTSNTIVKDGLVANGFVSDDWTTSDVRTLAPPRPHNTKINGNVRSSTLVDLFIGVNATVTWNTRFRGSAVVALQLDAAEYGEVNADALFQVHRVIIVDSAAAVHDCGLTDDDISHNSLTFVIPSAATGNGTLYVQAETTIGGVTYTSLYNDVLPINIVPSDARITEAGDLRITEAGDARILE